ncbi:MAG: ABC transporter permease, partial [Proteobacteria bacterium]|nr:ABC transporter permease [Pseudomonadota bacterium]
IVFSGNLLPLMLLPESWQGMLLLQPLAGVMDIPLRMYFGLMSGPDAWAGFGLQLLWLVALVGLGRMAMARAMGRLEVQGG